MRAYLILPGVRKVEVVHYNGSAADLEKSWPYKSMELIEVNNRGDHLLFNPMAWEDGTHQKEGAWGVHCDSCKVWHEYAGVGVIFGTNEVDNNVFQDPYYSERQFTEAIEWFGQGRAPQDRPDQGVEILHLTGQELIDYLVGKRH